jgi:hypothetical protein
MSQSRILLVLAVTGAVFAPLGASAQPHHEQRGRPQAGHYQGHAPPPARYGYHGGYQGGYHDNTGAVIGGALLGLGLGAVIGGALAAPPVYAPPPVYYAPPPNYYSQPPAVYYGY